MAKRHLSSLNAPINWPIKRKESKFVVRPNPGPHPLERSLPLKLLITGILNYAKNTREVNKILQNNEIIVNNKTVRDVKFPVGIMDNIAIKKTSENFMLFIDENNKYKLKRINEEDAKTKLCKIVNKKTLKKGITQLNLYDGRNLVVNKDEYKVGDTLIIDLNKNKIASHLKLDKNAFVYLTGGKYIGHFGKVESINNAKGLEPAKILIKYNDKIIETLKDYAFVVNEDILKVQNE